MLTAAIIFALGFVVNLVVTERLRNIVGARRERQGGLNATQDVAAVGILISFACVVAAFVCVGFWLSSR